jgi:hypothetical protein
VESEESVSLGSTDFVVAVLVLAFCSSQLLITLLFQVQRDAAILLLFAFVTCVVVVMSERGESGGVEPDVTVGGDVGVEEVVVVVVVIMPLRTGCRLAESTPAAGDDADGDNPDGELRQEV